MNPGGDDPLERVLRHLAAAQQLARMGSFDHDLGTRRATWSPMMYELHGVAPGTPAPASVDEYARLLHPDDVGPLGDASARTIASGEVSVVEIRVRKADGWRLLRAQFACERDAAGQPQRLSGTMQDITEEAERRADLIRERERAEEDGRAKTRFLTRVTHELRTPLAGVIGMIDLAVGDVSAAARADHLASARASARHLLELIDDLLDASREDTWRINVVDIEFDLAVVLDQALAMVAPRAQRKQLRLTGTVEVGVATKRIGDPLRLRQVLVNLLYNAVKFTHRGQVQARIAAGVAGEVVIVVEDTGIGIAPEQQAAVFEPFMQASAERGREGVGLGLAITRELVSALGGTIELTSAPGVGTTFTVRLPLQPSTGRHPAERVRTIEPASSPMIAITFRSLRVLVAEDSPVNAEIARAMVDRIGHTSRWVSDGRAAVEAAAAEPFDVILMDLEMPHLDGAAATRAIRAAEHAAGRPRVPVIAVSAHHDAELTAASAGMDACMRKPIDLDALAVLLARAGSGELAGPIDHAARLARVGGRSELARTIVGTFLSHQPTLLEPIDQALTAGSGEDLHRAAHGLRGALAMVGAQRAAELAGTLERAALSEAMRLRDLLVAELARVGAELALVR